jgi:hypothetical protein
MEVAKQVGLLHAAACRYGCYAAAALALLASGCGQPNPLGRQAISGNILFDGQPLDAGSIEFTPHDPAGVSSGALIVDGVYRIAAPLGLPPGKYTVRITSPRDASPLETEIQPPGPQARGPRQPPPAVERIPAEYNVKSDKSVDVSAESVNRFDYDIPAKTGR